MGLSTGSRITVDGKNATVIVTNWAGTPVMFKYDSGDSIYEVRGQTIVPIIVK